MLKPQFLMSRARPRRDDADDYQNPQRKRHHSSSSIRSDAVKRPRSSSSHEQILSPREFGDHDERFPRSENRPHSVSENLFSATGENQKTPVVPRPTNVVIEPIETHQEFVTFLQQLILGRCHRFPNRVKVFNSKRILSSTFIRINFCSDKDDESAFPFLVTHLQKSGITPLPVACTSRSSFWGSMMSVSSKKISRVTASAVQDAEKEVKTTYTDKFNRLQLLCTYDQLESHCYPLEYEPLVEPTPPTPDSPIFVLDCEMVETDDDHFALAKVTVMNEFNDIVLNTLVLPTGKITDYRTKFSGIDEKVLDGVMTTRDEVHVLLRRILSPNAILAGHSLDNDLKALKFCHPYCIDTSLVYNLSGKPKHKPSLRQLTYVFLRRVIQKGEAGHCSVQDCQATLDLIKLKLLNGLEYGNKLHDFPASAMPTPSENPLPIPQTLPYADPIHCINCAARVAIPCRSSDCLCSSINESTFSSLCVQCQTSEASDTPDPLPSTVEVFYRGLDSFCKSAMNTVLWAIRDPLPFTLPDNKFFKILNAQKMDGDVSQYLSALRPLCIENRLNLLEVNASSASLASVDSALTAFLTSMTVKNTVVIVLLANKQRKAVSGERSNAHDNAFIRVVC